MYLPVRTARTEIFEISGISRMAALRSCKQPSSCAAWVAMRCAVRDACLSCVYHEPSGAGEWERSQRFVLGAGTENGNRLRVLTFYRVPWVPLPPLALQSTCTLHLTPLATNVAPYRTLLYHGMYTQQN